MAIVPPISSRPPGVDCVDWTPASPGAKKCAYFMAAIDDVSPGGCSLMVAPGTLPEPIQSLRSKGVCTEWAKRNGGLPAVGTNAPESPVASARVTRPPPDDPHNPDPLTLDLSPRLVGAPKSLPVVPPSMVRIAEGTAELAFSPAKDIDPERIAELASEVIEIELSVPTIPGGKLFLVAKPSGLPRAEMTYASAAILRLIVDAFPGAHVTGFVPAPHGFPSVGTLLDALRDRPLEDFPRVPDVVCADCGEPQYATPGGPSCKNGHGGADSRKVSDSPEPDPFEL